jgi:hypothetical protein
LEKQHADEGEYARLVIENLSVAPIYSGLDGGMNKVFLARFPGSDSSSLSREANRMPGI